jgi:sugar phosphate isomerase/epimerase
MGTSRSLFSSEAVGVCLATLLPDPMATCEAADLQQTVEAAAGAGFTQASVWEWHAAKTGVEATRGMVDAAGLKVRALETAIPWSAGPETAMRKSERALDIAEALGADILLASANPSPLDVGLASEGFAALCERANGRGMTVVVEFIPFRTIGDLATTWAIIEAAGAPNGGILLDMMHWHYQTGGPDLSLLETIPGAHVPYVQVCDAPPGLDEDSYMTAAVSARPLPGEGVVDIGSLLDVLARIGADPYFAFEGFSTELLDQGPAAMAERLRAAAQTLFA